MNENEREKKQMEPANDAETQKQAQIDQRRRMIQLLAGTYLLYLAYQLISSAVQEAAWSTMKIVSLIAGAIFGTDGRGAFDFQRARGAEACQRDDKAEREGAKRRRRAMNNSMNDLMNLISVLCGGYCLYTWFRLVREKRLFENGILLPKDRKPEDCVDEDAYIRIIRPKLGILGTGGFPVWRVFGHQ